MLVKGYPSPLQHKGTAIFKNEQNNMNNPDDKFTVIGRATAKQPHLTRQRKSSLTQKECWAFNEELVAQGYTRIEVRRETPAAHRRVLSNYLKGR